MNEELFVTLTFGKKIKLFLELTANIYNFITLVAKSVFARRIANFF